MIKLKDVLIRLKENVNESTSFTNWQIPSDEDLRREFRVEHEMKELNYFSDVDEFLEKCKSAKHVVITPAMDSNIQYRSRTKSFDQLLSLIKGYRSYPKYRNEETLKSMYTAFKSNKKMDMPIILKFKDGSMRIFAGNTRMDVAFQLNINPKVLMVEVNKLSVDDY